MTIKETNLKFTNALTKRNKTDYIVIHHAAAANCSADDIHRWHLNNGWAGIGYHYLVRKNGDIFRGRPVDTVGAQCKDYNSVSIGICAEGAYDTTDKEMPHAQKAAFKWLISELRKTYKTAKVVKHKDLNATSCPGRYFPFEEILIASASPTPATPTELTTTNDIVWELSHRGILSDKDLWLKKMDEDVNVYWLGRKMVAFLRAKGV